jgi:SulP family sulfate permease
VLKSFERYGGSLALEFKGACVAATSSIAFSIANGALIFSGAAPSLLCAGIISGFVTTAVTTIVMALLGTFKPVIGTANSTTAAPLGAIVAASAASLALLTPDKATATVFALVFGTTIASGLVLLLLGSARLGRLVRFIPFPIIAGFMGVTGVLLLLGAIRFGTGVSLTLRGLPDFLRVDVTPLLGLSVGFAAVIAVVARSFRHALVLPGLLLAATLATDAAVYAGGYSVEMAPIDHLFLLPKAMAHFDIPIFSGMPWMADWSFFPPLFGAIAAYVALVILTTLLVSTQLESALNVDANYNRELRAQGLACFFAGLLGGFVGNPSVGATTAAMNSGARMRICGIFHGLIVLAVLIIGLPLLPYIPGFVIAGFLIFVSGRIIWTWCVETRSRMPLGEWLLILAMVAIAMIAGLVAAILAGLVAGCILFAIDVSRIDIVRRDFGLDRRGSLIVRSREELAVLSRYGARVRFIELNGMLFFGSAYQIFAHVRQITATEHPKMIVLDFTKVSGCDSSATAVLARMRRGLARDTIKLAFAGGKKEVIDLLRSAGCFAENDMFYATREQALDAGELMVLKDFADTQPQRKTLAIWLSEALGSAILAEALMGALICTDNEPGAYICRQGDPAMELYFIEEGRVRVVVRTAEVETTARVFGAHTITGEYGFLAGIPRTASLIVEEQARVWILDRSRFDSLAQEHPSLVIALLRDIVRIQSERLTFATLQNAALA